MFVPLAVFTREDALCFWIGMIFRFASSKTNKEGKFVEASTKSCARLYTTEHNQMKNEWLSKFVQTDNASSNFIRTHSTAQQSDDIFLMRENKVKNIVLQMRGGRRQRVSPGTLLPCTTELTTIYNNLMLSMQT